MMKVRNNLINAVRREYLKKYYSQEGPGQVVVKLTNACNLKCVYCYSESGCGTEYISLDTVESFFDQYFDECYGNVNCTFHGGEPMMNVNLMKDIVSMLQSKYYAPRVMFSIQTNATLISDKNIDFIRDTFPNVGVSLDGYGDLHNITRMKVDGKGSFDEFVRGIGVLREHNVSYGGLIVVTKHNVDYICEIIDWSSRSGFHSLGIEMIFLGGRGALHSDLMVSPEKYWEAMKKAIDWLAEFNKDKSESERFYIRDFESVTDKIIYDGKGHMCSNMPCGAGSRHISLNYDGDIYVCDCLDGEKEYVLGNIKQDTYADIMKSEIVHKFANRDQSILHECCECEYKKWCLNGCVARNIIYYGLEGYHKKNYLCYYYKNMTAYFYDLLVNKKLDPGLFKKYYQKRAII